LSLRNTGKHRNSLKPTGRITRTRNGSSRARSTRKKQESKRIPARLEAAIKAECLRLNEAHALLVCLYQVLLYADGQAACYADVANVAARILNASIDRFDTVNLGRVSPDPGTRSVAPSA
jgi:hypothetical protein